MSKHHLLHNCPSVPTIIQYLAGVPGEVSPDFISMGNFNTTNLSSLLVTGPKSDQLQALFTHLLLCFAALMWTIFYVPAFWV